MLFSFPCLQRELGQNFQSTFFPTDYAQFNGDPADNPTFTRYFIFNVNDVIDGIDLLLESYWNLPQLASVPTEIARAANPAAAPRPGSAADIPVPTVTWTRFEVDPSRLFDPSTSPSLATASEVVTIGGPGETWPTAGRNASDIRALLLRTVDLRYHLRFWAWDPVPDQDAIGTVGRCFGPPTWCLWTYPLRPPSWWQWGAAATSGTLMWFTTFTDVARWVSAPR